MLATAEQIIETWKTKPSFRSNIKYALMLPSGAKPTITYIDKMLEGVFDRIENNRMGKGIRPWEIVDTTAGLDPELPWIGIEFETGFDSSTDYHKVMNHLWKNHHNNAVDYEGCGEYPCEITFCPVDINAFGESSYNMDRLLTWMNAQSIEQGYDDGDDDMEEVGIHVNISTAGMRTDEVKAGYICELLCATLEDESVDVGRFFGRHPYGYFNVNGNSSNGQYWIEGKLFKSTHDMEQWEDYKITINNMALLVEHLATLTGNTLGSAGTITNFDEILAGEIDAEQVQFSGRASSEEEEDQEYSDW